MDVTLRSFIPGAVLSRLVAGESSWLAELRRITVLFVNLPMFDHNTPIEQAQIVARTLQTVLYRYEGSVNKISVDDKGTTLVAALGCRRWRTRTTRRVASRRRWRSCRLCARWGCAARSAWPAGRRSAARSAAPTGASIP